MTLIILLLQFLYDKIDVYQYFKNIKLDSLEQQHQTSKAYLAHKSVLGYYSNQTLILNASFKINYSQKDHQILCKITDIRDHTPFLIGTVKIDLDSLNQRKLIFIPFDNQDKILQIKLYQHKKEEIFSQGSSQIQASSSEIRNQFLQERYQFLDKTVDHEIKLKKKFSEKVYNLLKELKNTRNDYIKSERENTFFNTAKESNFRKNETPNYQFKRYFDDNKKGAQTVNNHRQNQHINNRKKSPSPKPRTQELLIDSVHAKPKLKSKSKQHAEKNNIHNYQQLNQITQQDFPQSRYMKGNYNFLTNTPPGRTPKYALQRYG